MGELEIEVLELATVECRQRPGTAVEPPTRPRLRAASDLARRRRSASSPVSAMAVEGSSAATYRAARWGIGGKRGCGGIGFRPASAPQTRSYTGWGLRLRAAAKIFTGRTPMRALVWPEKWAEPV